MLARVAVLVVVAAATLFAAANVQVGWLYALGAIDVGVLFASLALALGRLRAVAVTCRVDPLTARFSPLAVSCVLENRGIARRAFLRLVAPSLGDTRPAALLLSQRPPEHWAVATLEDIPAGAAGNVTLAVPAPRRGVFTAPPIYLLSSPLGLFTAWRTLRLPGEIVVTPQVVAIDTMPWFHLDRHGGEDHPLARTVPHGEVIRSTRDYRSGDPLRAVHWRGTARAGRLVVKETEGTAQTGGATVVLDLAGHTDSSLEHAISVAASLAAHFHGLGSSVRLVSQQGVVEGSLAEQLEALARATPATASWAPHLQDLDPTGCVVVSARDTGWLSIASCWIQTAPAGIEPAPGALFCPPGCDLAAVLRDGAGKLPAVPGPA